MQRKDISTLFPQALARGWAAVWVLLFAASYFLAHRLAFLFPDAGKVLTTIWPAGGLGLAALLLSPRRLWPAMLAALFVAGNLADVLAGRSLASGLGFTAANAIESLACAWVMQAWCGREIRFTHMREVAALVFAAMAVNAATACIGAGTAALALARPFWHSWISWYVADALGILVVAPFVITWATRESFSPPVRWSRALEWAIFMTLWGWLVWDAFRVHRSPFAPHPYMLPVLLGWAALRFGPRTVTLALVLLGGLSLVNPAVRVGPGLWGGQTEAVRVFEVQIFVAFCAVAGFLLATSPAEAMRAEHASREGHERVRALSDNLPNGMVYQADRDQHGHMRFLHVGAGCAALNGIPAESVMADASLLYRLVAEVDQARLAREEETSARTMKPLRIDLRLHRPDGEVRWMLFASSPRRLQDGRTVWDGIQLDITERKRTEEFLANAQKLDSIGILAGGIAHDFNNLLAVIVGNLSLAQIASGESGARETALANAAAACKRAAELSRRLLTFSKGGNPVREVARLAPIIVESTQMAVSGSNVLVEFDLPDDLPPARIDVGQMRQVFSNLAINAREAMPGGGKLRIQAREQVLGEAEVAGLAPGRYLKLTVRDQGKGIPEAILDRIFDPYFTTKQMGTQKGQGLGLTICHSIMAKHDGAIEVSSTPDQGTLFTLYVPASEDAVTPAPVVALPSTAGDRVGPRRILVVDDEADIRTLLERMLRRMGHEPVCVADSTTAVAAYRQALADGKPFDLALLDLTVPGGSGGIEILRELRAVDPAVKAIVTSGYADDPAMQNCRAFGFSAALAKPFSSAALRDAIAVA